jgi:hypothetical protein
MFSGNYFAGVVLGLAFLAVAVVCEFLSIAEDRRRGA